VDRAYLRPLDLRRTAWRFLYDEEPPASADSTAESAPAGVTARAADQAVVHGSAMAADPPAGRVLRVLSYNIHSGRGLDGRVDLGRLRRIIAGCRADVVALQEVDVNRPRTGGADQAAELADALEMDCRFHPTVEADGGQYGLAIFSRYPLREVRADGLPQNGRREPRGAQWLALDLDETVVQILNTHLGLQRGERDAQAEALLGPHWLGHPECRRATLLCGDLNAGPHTALCRRFNDTLQNVALVLGSPLRTWMGVRQLDYIFATPDWQVREVRMPVTTAARTASDHRPLLAELVLPRSLTAAT
jgi:endonuclease/exonuclease/phosphatase family metal-dependent hydrolase